MIQPLRTVHRRAFVALALVLPAVVLVGLGARRPRPRPTAQVAAVPASAYVVRESGKLWHKHSIRSAFYSDTNNPQDMYVVLQPAQELNEPDLLLYWADTEPERNSLPAQARLLGAFVAGCPFALQGEREGLLVLYSLAHQEISDTATVEKLP